MLNKTLQGNEANLIGYWRLDAINNNTVTNLVDNTVNHQVLGMERGVPGSAQPFFKCTYWGQKTHRSTNKTAFPGNVTEIKPASEMDWFVASCRFTVPQEVNLVRCFEVSDVTGSWETLQLRKHRIRKISDVITEASYTDKLVLSPLGSPQGEAFSHLEQLQQKELEEQTLLKKKVELEAELAALNVASDKQTAISNKQKEINQQQSMINNLTSQVSAKYNTYQNELNNPLNYWCRITSQAQEVNADNECIRIDIIVV